MVDTYKPLPQGVPRWSRQGEGSIDGHRKEGQVVKWSWDSWSNFLGWVVDDGAKVPWGETKSDEAPAPLTQFSPTWPDLAFQPRPSGSPPSRPPKAFPSG